MLPCEHSSLQSLNGHFTRKGLEALCQVPLVMDLSSIYMTFWHMVKPPRPSPSEVVNLLLINF